MNIEAIVKRVLKEFGMENLSLRIQFGTAETLRRNSPMSTNYSIEGNGNLRHRLTYRTDYNWSEAIDSKWFDYRFKDFLNSVNVNITEGVVLLTAILHEIGHMHDAEEMASLGLIEQHKMYRSTQNNILDMTISKDKRKQIYKETGAVTYYRLGTVELYADNFVYRRFCRMYRILKDEGMI